jgi:hypothetical protein
MKMAVFWVVAPCRLVRVYRRFRGLYCLHHQGEVNSYQSTRRYNPEDGHLQTLRSITVFRSGHYLCPLWAGWIQSLVSKPAAAAAETLKNSTVSSYNIYYEFVSLHVKEAVKRPKVRF